MTEKGLFFIKNRNGLIAEICNPGLVLKSLRIPLSNGTSRDVVLGFSDRLKYAEPNYFEGNYPYLGAIIGRYANRISGAAFQIDHNTYLLQANNGPNCLHGGNSGFDRKEWEITAIADDRIRAKYISQDGEEGFPGTLTTHIEIALNSNDELSMEIRAVTDAPTPVNLTWHPYFNLDGGADAISDHSLVLNCDAYLEQDADLCPTGRVLNMKGSPLDYTHRTTLNKAVHNGGIDTSFVIQRNANEGMVQAAQLWSSDQILRMEVWTDAPIVHVYTGQSLPHLVLDDARKTIPFSGICLECQQYTNAINIPSFPETILMPGQQYRQKIVYRFLQIRES